jgi:hypothetical protein
LSQGDELCRNICLVLLSIRSSTSNLEQWRGEVLGDISASKLKAISSHILPITFAKKKIEYEFAQKCTYYTRKKMDASPKTPSRKMDRSYSRPILTREKHKPIS